MLAVSLPTHTEIKVPYEGPIRNYQVRRTWSERQRRHGKHLILAFYNSGRHLFVDPCFKEAHCRSTLPWKWIRFKEYVEPCHLNCSQRSKCLWRRGAQRKWVLFQNCGIDANFKHNVIRVGYDPENPWCINPRECYIPPLSILYVAVKKGRVVDTLHIFQPLPCALLDTTSSMVPVEMSSSVWLPLGDILEMHQSRT